MNTAREFARLAELFENVMDYGEYSRKKEKIDPFHYDDHETISFDDGVILHLNTTRLIRDDEIDFMHLFITKKLSNGDMITYGQRDSYLEIDGFSLDRISLKKKGKEISFTNITGDTGRSSLILAPVTKVPGKNMYTGNYPLKGELRLLLCKYFDSPELLEYFSKNTLISKRKNCS